MYQPGLCAEQYALMTSDALWQLSLWGTLMMGVLRL